MIEVKNNKIIINDTHLSFPIRIKQVIEIEDFIFVSIAYDYTLDVGIEWNNGGKEKWNELNRNFNNSALYCFDKFGNKIWEFNPKIFVDVLMLDEELVENDIRLKSWIINHPDKKSIFIVDDGDRLIVNYKTGEIYKRLEMR